MKRGSRSKTSPKVAHELWEQLTDKPALHDREYGSWHWKHIVEPWLIMLFFAVLCVAMLTLGLIAVFPIFAPKTPPSTTRDIAIIAQRVIIAVYIGVVAFASPDLIRTHFQYKPKTKLNRFLSAITQIAIAIACFLGWLILASIIRLSDETLSRIGFTLFIGASLVYIARAIFNKTVSQRNIGVFLLVITTCITSVLALIHSLR